MAGGKAGRSRGQGSDDAGAKVGLTWKVGSCRSIVGAALDGEVPVGEVGWYSGRCGVLAGAASTESREWESCSLKSGAGRGSSVITQVETEGWRGAERLALPKFSPEPWFEPEPSELNSKFSSGSGSGSVDC